MRRGFDGLAADVAQGEQTPRLCEGFDLGRLGPESYGYTGFGHLYEAGPKTGAPTPLIEVACWAHARRKIFNVRIATKSPAAAEALDMIARLFAIEAEIRGKAPAERAAASTVTKNGWLLVNLAGPDLGAPPIGDIPR